MCRSPLLPLLARELGASAPMVGLVVAASTITGVFLKLPAGTLSDVIGRVPLLLTAAAVFAVMPFSYLLSGSLAVLIALRFVHGSATAIMGPVMSATISDLAPSARRATWLSLYSTIQGAGQAVGPVIAGFLIARGRYDLAFILAGVIALATPALVMSLRAPGVAASESSAANRKHFIQGIREVVAERRILVASIAHAFYFVINGTLNAFLPLFAQDRIGLTPVDIGWLFGLQTVTTLAITAANRRRLGSAGPAWSDRARFGWLRGERVGHLAGHVSVGAICSGGDVCRQRCDHDSRHRRVHHGRRTEGKIRRCAWCVRYDLRHWRRGRPPRGWHPRASVGLHANVPIDGDSRGRDRHRVHMAVAVCRDLTSTCAFLKCAVPSRPDAGAVGDLAARTIGTSPRKG